MQDFVNASDCYEQLSMMHPEIEEYKLYYSQALYKACLYAEAMKTACQIDNPARQGEVNFVFFFVFFSDHWIRTQNVGQGRVTTCQF